MTRKVDRAALIESAAITLYEAGRGVEYIEPDWDWPNIDRSYDRDDEDDGDPEWLRNRYRSEARDVLDAVSPLVAQAIAWFGPLQREDSNNEHACSEGCAALL